jgi:hypothetical protein
VCARGPSDPPARSTPPPLTPGCAAHRTPDPATSRLPPAPADDVLRNRHARARLASWEPPQATVVCISPVCMVAPAPRACQGGPTAGPRSRCAFRFESSWFNRQSKAEINDDGSQAESHHEQSCGARCVVRRAGRWRVERPCAWALLHGCSFLPFGCALGCGMCVCMRPPDWFCGMACQFGRRRRPCAPAWRRASARWAPLSTLLVSCAAAIGVTVEA